MKVLLTGATGFIGSHVTELLLQRGHDVHALVRPNSDLRRLQPARDRLTLIEGDLLAANDLRVQPEVCLHLAWDVEPGRYLTSPRNSEYLSATLALAQQLARCGCRRLLGIGTCFEYAPSDAPLREDGPSQSASPYAASKLAAAHALHELCARASMEFLWARLFYLYGPREDRRRLVPTIINCLLAGQPAELTTGEQVRDFLHVTDVASALVAAAESSVTGFVNIGSGEPTSVRKIATTIGGLLGRTDLLGFGLRPASTNEPPRIVADNKRLREQTAWRPQFDLVTGLSQTVEWWKNNR